MDARHWVVVGAGGLSREVICWADDAVRFGAAPSIRGYLVDSDYPRLGPAYNLPWLGSLDDYDPPPEDACLIAVSDPMVKRQIVRRLQARGAKFASLVHPTAVLAKTAVLGQGCIIFPYAIVSADTVLDDFVTINSMSGIGHDSKVGAYSTLSTHVDITGGVTVGESVFFGSGARVMPGLSVGHEAKVGAGAVVVRSVPAGVTVYTNPARRLC